MPVFLSRNDMSVLMRRLYLQRGWRLAQVLCNVLKTKVGWSSTVRPAV